MKKEQIVLDAMTKLNEYFELESKDYEILKTKTRKTNEGFWDITSVKRSDG